MGYLPANPANGAGARVRRGGSFDMTQKKASPLRGSFGTISTSNALAVSLSLAK
ncbi:MAG: hypothetical protein ACYC6P_10095 [Ignavibacteriaceae bacterium]